MKALVFRTQRLVNRTRRAGVDMDQGTSFEPGDRGIDLYQHRFQVSRSMSAARGCREDRHEFSPENDGTHHRGVGTTESLTQKFAACGAASRFTVAGLTVMANGYVDTRAPPDLSAGGGRLSARSEGCGVGAAGAADPAGIARRAFAQDRAGGDELHFIPAAHRLPLGATCRATAFRPARRSTTSSASFSARGHGRRSGLSCTWPCASR